MINVPMNGSFSNNLNEYKKLFLLITIFTFISILKIYPTYGHWFYPLHSDGAVHHHSILKIIYQTVIDPLFLKNDLLTNVIRDNYLIPYRSIIEFLITQFGFSLATIVNILTVMSVFLTFFGIGLLSYSATRNYYSVALTFSFIVLINSDIFLIDAIVNQPRFLSQGLCFISILFFLKKRITTSFIICVFASLFHYGMPFYLMIIYSAYICIRFKHYKIKSIVFSYFIFCSLYILFNFSIIKNIIINSGITFNFDAWKLIVKETGFFWSYKNINFFYILYGYFPIFFILLLLFRLKKWISTDFVSKINVLVISFMFTQIMHFIVYDVFFIPILVRPVIFNSQYYLPYFIAILLPLIFTYLLKDINNKKEKLSFFIPVDIFLVLIFFLVVKWYRPTVYTNKNVPGILEIILVISYLMEFLIFPGKLEKRINNYFIKRRLKSFEFFLFKSDKTKVVIFSILFLIIYCIQVIPKFNYSKSSIEVVTNNNWYNMQNWIKSNTKPDDVFILPNKLSMFGLRIYGERGTLCSNLYEAHLIALLAPRMTDKVISEITSFWRTESKDYNGDFLKVDNLIKFHNQRFNNLTNKDFIYIKKRFPNLKYIVTLTEKFKSFNLKFSVGNLFLYEIK